MQYRNICFTAYKLPEIKTEKVSYYIYQQECCPSTKKVHFQGYMEMNLRCSLKTIKDDIFNDQTVHIEQRRGSQQQAINYCKKLDSKMCDHVEFGKPKRQGSRTDLDEIAELAPTTSCRKLVETFGGNALRHINMIQKYQKCILDPDNIEKYLQAKDETIVNKDFMLWNIREDWLKEGYDLKKPDSME